MSDNNNLLIPGENLANNPDIRLPGTTGGVQQPQTTIISNLTISDKLLPPTVIARYLRKSGTHLIPAGITIQVFAFLSEHLKLTEGDFTYFYNLALNSDSSYKLTLYVTFSKKMQSAAPANVFQIMPLTFVFGNNAFDDNQLFKKEFPITQITTVEVIVVDTDPVTSRGTETTVQEGG